MRYVGRNGNLGEDADMAEAALARRLDTLEDYMKNLSYQFMRPQMELA